VNMLRTRLRITPTGVSEQTSFFRACISQTKWLMTLFLQKWTGIAMVGVTDTKKTLVQVPNATGCRLNHI
jgi:hypothetical protein